VYTTNIMANPVSLISALDWMILTLFGHVLDFQLSFESRREKFQEMKKSE
jgi:hypothetical protein